MKIYQEEEDKGFVEKAQIKGECGCLLYLENENKIISGDRTGTTVDDKTIHLFYLNLVIIK